MSKHDVARGTNHVELGNRTIYTWRKHYPGIDKVAKVANYFGVGIDYLYYGREEERRNGD